MGVDIMEKKYYKFLDILRVVACLGVLLYHIGLLKGGYLAVCTFFVLSGYLGVISAFAKEKFSLKEYYLNRIKKIYIPLLLVVFLSVTFVTLLSKYNWINLKPEVTSILLGYNNYWQLNANLDYFVRNVSTPFMHFWYIAIFLQLELIFPIIFIILKFLGKKISKVLPCLILLLIGIGSSIFFYKLMINKEIMQAYYGTLSRVFSFVFGLLLGFIHTYHKPITINNKLISKLIFCIYLVLLIVLFFIIDYKSILFNISMFITTFFSIRLIDYAISINSKKNNIDKIISPLSKISYEVYLVQYPIIFLIINTHINNILKVIIIILLTYIISAIIHYALDFKKKKIIKIVLLIPIIILSIYGLITYVKAKDYTEDMNKLKSDLEENRALIEQKQKEQLEKQKEEEDKWQDYLNTSEINEKDLEKKVRELRVIGIGDSIMELAIKNLYKEFPNGYFDAATNRTEIKAIDIIRDLKAKGIDSDVYILNIGTNGLCNVKCKERVIKTIGEDKYIFWLNATAPDYEEFNTYLEQVAKKHKNVFIIDWRSYGLAHQEYLIYDKVHPNVTGCGIYAKKIYEGVYNQYLKIYEDARNKKIKEHEELEKNKITFIGNDLLQGMYDQIDNYYQNKKILVDKYNYNKIKNIITDKSTSNNIVLVFDNNSKITTEEYNKLINIDKEKKITIVTTDNSIKISNANIIYYDPTGKTELDQIHLSNKGNNELFSIIKDKIK